MPHARSVEVPLEARLAYSFSEVAGLTGTAISTLHKWDRAGRIKTVKIGGRRLMTREELNRLLGATEGEPREAANMSPPVPSAPSTARPHRRKARQVEEPAR